MLNGPFLEYSEDNNSGQKSEDLRRDFIEQNLESDWHWESDKGDDIPDPNVQKEPQYHNSGKLPCRLHAIHFKEGLIYKMTFLKEKDKPILVMITATRTHNFWYRVFFLRSSSRKTHHAGTDGRQNI